MLSKILRLGPDETIRNVEPFLRHSWLWGLLLITFAIAAAVYLYRSESGLSKRRKTVMGVCQAAAVALLIFLLLGPTLRIEIIKPLRQMWIVLVDTSESMSLKDAPKLHDDVVKAAKELGKLPLDAKNVPEARIKSLTGELAEVTRLQRLTALLKKVDLAGQLGDNYEVRYLNFDSALHEAAGRDKTTEWLDARKARGSSSRIGSAIEQAVARFGGQKLAGVVVLSDWLSNEGDDPVEIASTMKLQGVPIYPLCIGVADTTDILVRPLIAPEVVFVGDNVPVRVRIDSHGFKDKTVELRLTVDDSVVESRDVKLTGGTQFEEMVYSPGRTAGTAKIVASVETKLPGEINKDNNASGPHMVKILDEKIKVLYIEGMPRWEYRYLRWVLLRDRRLDVQFLMTEGDPQLAKTSTIHRSTFPDDAETVMKYDLVILGDVPKSYFKPGQLQLLADLVSKGGGSLLMLAGQMGSPSTYVNSPIAEILPVKITADLWFGVKHDTYPVVTEDGNTSSVTSLASPRTLNDAIWQSIRPMDFLPALEGRKLGATVLVTVTRTPGVPDGYPLVAWQRYGKGKTMFVGTEDLWRLRREVGDKYHSRFWAQSIQFLALSRLLGDNKQVSLETDRGNYSAGDQVRLFATVVDEAFEPIVKPSFTVLVESKGSDDPDLLIDLKPVPGSLGLYAGVFMPKQDGNYLLKADDSRKDASNTVNFTVVTQSQELRVTGMQVATGAQVAERSGGRVLTAASLAALGEKNGDEKKLTTIEQREQDLWDLPAAFVLLVIITGIEWYMRRKENLV